MPHVTARKSGRRPRRAGDRRTHNITRPETVYEPVAATIATDPRRELGRLNQMLDRLEGFLHRAQDAGADEQYSVTLAVSPVVRARS